MTKAQQATTNKLLIGGALAAGAAFLWTKRSALFPQLAPAAAPPATTTTTPVYYPIVSAPTPLPQSYPTGAVTPPQGIPGGTVVAPNQIVVNTPNGPVVMNTTDPRIQGCVIGPQGGLVCPTASGATAAVSDAQLDPCKAPSETEIAACLVRKPLWSREYAISRLQTVRSALCAKQSWPYSAEAASSNEAQIAEYEALTGVRLRFGGFKG